jgi:hypothetical protein
MRGLRKLICLLAAVVPLVARPASSQQAAQTEANAKLPATSCPATQPVQAEPPREPGADPFGYGPWYVNSDRTMWAGVPGGVPMKLVSGDRNNKVIWIRPQGTQLEVTGHRLDANAEPLRAHIPCCYPGGFQITALYFSTDGCWEVTAKAGTGTLTFVTVVNEGKRSP